MDIKLISISPKGTRKVFPLAAPITVFGRQSDCDLQIQLSEISRQHCEVKMEGNKVVIKDRGSANGTFVNGQKITQQELNAGDVFSLANAINFLVQINGKPVNIDESKLRRAPITPPSAPAAAPTKTLPSKPRPAKAAEPAPSFASTATGPTDKDDADQILGDSFFLDLEEEEEEEKEK